MPPTASRNGTAKTVLLRRAIWRAIHAASATTAPMPPDAMFHRSAAKAIRATPCRNGTALLLFQRRPHSYPLCRPDAVTASVRPPCYSGSGCERPQQRPVNSKAKKPKKLLRAASARCKCRFSGSQSMFRRRPADWRQKPASSAGPPRYRLPCQSRPCPIPVLPRQNSS